MNEAKEFDRFKYAEEHAHDLAKAGKKFRMWNELAVPHEDDGEVYVYDEFLVQEVQGGGHVFRRPEECKTFHSWQRTGPNENDFNCTMCGISADNWDNGVLDRSIPVPRRNRADG